MDMEARNAAWGQQHAQVMSQAGQAANGHHHYQGLQQVLPQAIKRVHHPAGEVLAEGSHPSKGHAKIETTMTPADENQLF